MGKLFLGQENFLRELQKGGSFGGRAVNEGQHEARENRLSELEG